MRENLEQLESQSIREQVKENTNEIKSIKNEAKAKEAPKPESQNLNAPKEVSGDSPTASAAVEKFRQFQADKKENENPINVNPAAGVREQNRQLENNAEIANVIVGHLNPEATNLNASWENLM